MIWFWTVKAISIHAPARGQTGFIAICNAVLEISIHAPARGQTEHPATACTSHCYFNSRPREGANPIMLAGIKFSRIFQFTPPRGGKPHRWAPSPQTRYFNSRPREGANLLSHRGSVNPKYFNSRPREGANRKTSQYLATIHSFNSNNSRKSAVKLHIMSHSRADNAV